MSDTAAGADAWHRKFAAVGNNRAWELSVQVRGAAESREMLDAAHASAWHWAQVGTELNRMRATMLLAEVHALLGFGASALAYAEEMRAYFLTRETPDWELALTHTVFAQAAHAAGRSAEHHDAYARAEAALAAIADAEDRAIVAETFGQVAAPR
ncbi:MAG: hypothetical protein ACXWUL_02195 [Caldimonas sp.]